MASLFDRNKLKVIPLDQRISKSNLDILVDPASPPPQLPPEKSDYLDQLADRIQFARKHQAPVIIAYGAHMFKNGLSPLVVGLMEGGFIQHLITNGAGTIHDWELAYQGKTEENVATYLKQGQFGIWQETGFYLNLAITLGAAQGLGYGESIGKMIADEGLAIPSTAELREMMETDWKTTGLSDNYACQAALLKSLEDFDFPLPTEKIPHPHKEASLQYHAYRLGVPFSVCPGIGYDIIYTHPINSGVAIGQAALRDFLAFAHTVSNLENGVYISVGSAIMAPQTMEKALSMARNLAIQEQRPLNNIHIVVDDIQPGDWDWTKGEPPKDHPAYYLRFCKSFSRMGGDFHYIELDNTLFLKHLYHRLLQ